MSDTTAVVVQGGDREYPQAQAYAQEQAPEQTQQQAPVECGNPYATETAKYGGDQSPETYQADEDDGELVSPAVVLPWRIGLFLLTSTIVQNMSYNMTGVAITPYAFGSTWTMEENQQFMQLVYNMIYLGPVFALVVDLTRVFRERFRPVIVVACLVNAALCFALVGEPDMKDRYGRSLMVCWLMQIAVMYIYMPMNAVVIAYGNSLLESSSETSARIGGLMAQAMVWRTVGSFLYTFIGVYAVPKMSVRYVMLMPAIGSLLLIVQVLLPWSMKRGYFLDRRESKLMYSAPVRFLMQIFRVHRSALSRESKSRGGTFMFILCFVFIYFMVPDALYNTQYTFNYYKSVGLTKGNLNATSLLGAFGAVVGALAYAVWMYVAQQLERGEHNRVMRTNPWQIALAGCSVWAFGNFFHLIGVFGTNSESFSYKVFLPIQSFVVQTCLRFSFMPTMSLMAMHAPRGYETVAFQLYSVATTGGGTVSYSVTDSLMNSMYVTVLKGYWKACLMFIVFQFLPMLIAVSLPKYRDDEDGEKEKELEEGESSPFAPLKENVQ